MPPAYKPAVTVSTQYFDNEIVIKIKDIGTGFGLSLAYDIVTKGHGGTIEIETKEGEGTTLIVKLPIQPV